MAMDLPDPTSLAQSSHRWTPKHCVELDHKPQNARRAPSGQGTGVGAARLVIAALFLTTASSACSGSTPGGGGTGGGLMASGGGPASGGATGGGSTGGMAAGGGTGAAATGGSGVGGASGGAMTGGADGLGGTPVGADWATTEERLGLSCGNSICHGGTEKLCLAKDGDRVGGEGSNCLPGTTLHATLLATQVKECENLPLVNPGKPSESALVRLISRQCGEFVMPANCPPEEQGYPTCWPEYAILDVSAWIANGAPAQ